MVRLATLNCLTALEAEMERSGRPEEQRALHEARLALVRSDQGFVTTGIAAERLSISIPTVKRWIARGVLTGGLLDTRWLVETESIERVLALRRSLHTLDREGNPAPAEIELLYSQHSQPPSKV